MSFAPTLNHWLHAIQVVDLMGIDWGDVQSVIITTLDARVQLSPAAFWRFFHEAAATSDAAGHVHYTAAAHGVQFAACQSLQAQEVQRAGARTA